MIMIMINSFRVLTYAAPQQNTHESQAGKLERERQGVQGTGVGMADYN